jgi:hypothetical protein
MNTIVKRKYSNCNDVRDSEIGEISNSFLSVSRDDDRVLYFDIEFANPNKGKSGEKDEYSESSSLLLLETSLLMDGIARVEEVNPWDLKNKLAFTSVKNFSVGVLILFIMVFSCSLIGPLTLSLPAKNPLVKSMWRTQGNAIVSIVFMLVNYGINRNTMSFLKDHSALMLLNSAKLAFFSFLWHTLFIVGCSMTVSSHATALYNGTGIFILLFSLATFRHVHKLEIFGYLLFGVGIIWLVTDTQANKATSESNTLSGNLVALLGAAFGAIHCFLMQRCSRAYHPLTLLTHCFCFSSVYQLILFPHFTGYENFYSFDADLGAFGWLGNFSNFTLMF